jgi:hypothetical protein
MALTIKQVPVIFGFEFNQKQKYKAKGDYKNELE